jgi:hypothetical protein
MDSTDLVPHVKFGLNLLRLSRALSGEPARDAKELRELNAESGAEEVKKGTLR